MDGRIDVEGKKFVFEEGDVAKLSSSDGCQLKIVTERTYNLDDESISDEEESFDEVVNGPFSEQIKLERMRREYISLVLNSNRDPVKPGNDFYQKKKLLIDGEQDPLEDEQVEYASLEDECSRIHKRYTKLGNYEDVLNNKENAFEEISPGRVFKRKLSSGVASLVSEETLVIYNCAFWTEKSSDPFDSTWLRRNVITTDLSTDSVLPGLRELLLTTRKNEWCEAFIRPEAAFGRLGAMPRIPPNATVFCLLEVVNVVGQEKIFILSPGSDGFREGAVSFEDLYEASNEARMRGNYYHDQKQYKAAIQRYKSGIRMLELLTYKDEIEEDRAQQLLLRLYNNCARSAISLGDTRFALAACRQASHIDRDNKEPKIMWFRMAAWKKMGHLDKALGVARRAMQLFKDSKTCKSFQREADELQKRIKQGEDDSDNLLRLMSRAIFT